MAKYVYPAIVTVQNDGTYASVIDNMKSCEAYGNDLYECLKNAEDNLGFILYGYEKQNTPVPTVTNIKTIPVNNNQFTTYITCDTMEYRKIHDNKAVKKTLTVPSWLSDMAEHENISYSAVLQKALKKQLNIEDEM